MRLLFFIEQLTDLSTYYNSSLLAIPTLFDLIPNLWKTSTHIGDNYSHIVEKTLFYSLRTSCGKLPPFMIK